MSGVLSRTATSLMKPFAPFLRTMDGHREIMQLHDPVSSDPKQPLLEAVPPKVVRDCLYPTKKNSGYTI